jgi:hypothetical protein
MTPDELIAALQAQNILLAVNGDRLRVDAPTGTLTTELRAALAQHKTDLIARLMNGNVAHSPQETAQLGLFDHPPQQPALPVMDDGVSIRTADDWLNLMPDDEPTCQPPDEEMPVIDSLIALLARWEQADDPAHPRWRHLWAQAEIAAGLPCFEMRHHGARGSGSRSTPDRTVGDGGRAGIVERCSTTWAGNLVAMAGMTIANDARASTSCQSKFQRSSYADRNRVRRSREVAAQEFNGSIVTKRSTTNA